MPHLSHTAIRMLDDCDIGEPLLVSYWMQDVTLIADGDYGGLCRKEMFGENIWCILMRGSLGVEIAIPMINVIDVKRAGLPPPRKD